MASYADSENSSDCRWQTRLECAIAETGGWTSRSLWYLDAEYSNSARPRGRHESRRCSLSALGRESLRGTRTRRQRKGRPRGTLHSWNAQTDCAAISVQDLSVIRCDPDPL